MAEKITYSYLESLIERQNRAEQEMLAAWENGSFTFRHPFIRVNPYLINPLAAVICFETGGDTDCFWKRGGGKYYPYLPPGKETHPSGAGIVCRLQE